MNAQSMCRELIENARRCGLHYGHHGQHQCCSLHAPRPGFERSNGAWGERDDN